MADKLHLLTTTDAERIGKVVKIVEAQAQRQAPVPNKDAKVTGSNGFWARITGRDYTNKTYAWTKIIPQDDQTWDDDTDITGTTTDKPARELNDFVFVPDSSRVFLKSRYDYYVFEWQQYSIHGVVDSTISSSSTGAVSVHDNSGDTSQNINAKNIGNVIIGGTKVICIWYGGTWYISPAGDTNELGAIIQVSSSTAGVDCLWDGNVLTPVSGSACSGPFSSGTSCKLLVLNSSGGSAAGADLALTVGDKYLARYLFDASSVPVYAIRWTARSPRWFRATLYSDLAAGDTSVEVDNIVALDGLPTGLTEPLSIHNWHSYKGANNDEVSFVEDLSGVEIDYLLQTIDHKAKTVVLNVASDDIGAPTKVTEDRIEIVCMAGSGSSTTTDVIDFVGLEVLVDSFVDDLSDPTLIGKTTRTITTIPRANDATDHNVVTLETQQAVINSMVDSAGNPTQIQKRTRTLTVFPSTDDSATSTVANLTAVDLVVNSKVDSATDTTKIQQEKTTYRMFATTNSPVTTDVVSLVSQTVVTNSKVDSATDTTKIQQEKTIFKGFPTTAAPATTDVVTLADQVCVDNVKLDNTTTPTKIQQTKKTIKRFPTTNADADTDVLNLSSC